VDNQSTTLYASISLLALAVLGLVTSLFIPIAAPAHGELKMSRSITVGSIKILKAVYANKTIAKAIFFTSWFWLCGSVFLSLFPGYVKEELHADENLYAIFLASFSIGIAAGALSCAKILKNQITPKYSHRCLFGVVTFTGIMVGLSTLADKSGANLQTVGEFFSHWYAVPLFLSMVATAFCWGIYNVPLKTLIQAEASDHNRSRIIAGENIVNAVFMVLAGIINIFLLGSGVDILMIFTIIGILNLFAGIIAIKLWKDPK
jgi:acyl-[acyl-carrier-protein]-phospholipid O-acyltransferase/long-chain-fatty-acid--[acyl-carrier-protein] ligase